MEANTRPAIFNEQEAEFLCRGGLGRVATISPEGVPHVVPVVFEFDGQYVYFSGRNLERSRTFRHLALNQKVAIVVDDVVSVSPWRARGIEIRGIAELLTAGGRPIVRIIPQVLSSWGL